MPTILKIGPYRFFFYSNEYDEPPHIHIERDRSVAKFWLSPISLSKSTRFSPREIRKMQELVEEHRDTILEAWNEYFKS